MNVFSLSAFVWGHPLNRRGKIKAVLRLIKWQVVARLLPSKIALPFVSGSSLLVKKGMTGATGNFYCGLHEPDDMGFVLHMLRDGDLFIDVGANIGSYTVLAATAGARVIAIEPIPSTFVHLKQNLLFNEFDLQNVRANCVGVADRAGRLLFTADKDTMNHVMSEEDDPSQALEVPVTTLDQLCFEECPVVIKIDVEGYEHSVLQGASTVLSSQSLLAVLLETNGSGARYGLGDDEIISRMASHGFKPIAYDSITRRVSSYMPKTKNGGNTIFVRNEAEVSARVAGAPRYTLVNGTI